MEDWYSALNRLNLNRMLTFLIVAEERSFRAAAMRMHVSQSAVSVQIKQLEEALGLALFHRTTRSVSLTKEGNFLFEVAQKCSGELLQATTVLREQANLQHGIVVVAAMPALAVILLPSLMRSFANINQGIDVRLLDVDSQRVLEVLRSGEADIALLSRTDDMADVTFRPLFRDEFVVVIPKGSSVFRNRKKITVKELSKHPLILSPKGLQMRTLIDAMFSEALCAPKVSQECVRPQTLLSLVEAGFGLAIMAKSTLLHSDLSNVQVVQLKAEKGRIIGMVTLRNRAQSPASAAFQQFVNSNYRAFIPADLLLESSR